MLKPAGVRDIKKELQFKDRKSLEELCLRLSKYKKDNKEFLSYLLFWSEDEKEYVREIKVAIVEMMNDVNVRNVYWAKKTIRKVLRNMNKYIRFSSNPTTEIELRIFFCKEMKSLPLDWRSSKVLTNIYEGQLKKINQAMGKIHEDLKRDYEGDTEDISL